MASELEQLKVAFGLLYAAEHGSWRTGGGRRIRDPAVKGRPAGDFAGHHPSLWF